jgi:predicted membrane protein
LKKEKKNERSKRQAGLLLAAWLARARARIRDSGLAVPAGRSLFFFFLLFFFLFIFLSYFLAIVSVSK